MPQENLYRRGKTYYARVQVSGYDVRRSLHTADPRVAKQRLREILQEAEDRRAGIAAPAVHLWEEAVVQWATLQLGGLRPATQSRYKVSLAKLHIHFAGRPVTGITTADVHAYGVARMAGGVTAATVRRDMGVMSRVLRVAKRAGWITANPVPDEMEEIQERREAVRPVPLRHLARLVRGSPAGFADLIRFLARTGCRQEEAASLEWPELKLEMTPPTCTFARTKTRSPRVIELSPQTVRDLRRINRSSNNPHVFRSSTGDRFRHVSGRFRRLMRRSISAGRPIGAQTRGGAAPRASGAFRCHDLRHTYAIRALQAGRSIYTLARHLGHTTVTTTEMYAGWLSRPMT